MSISLIIRCKTSRFITIGMMVSCGDSPSVAPSVPTQAREIPEGISTNNEQQESDAQAPIAIPYIPPPTIGEPWAEWGVGQFNGNAIYSSPLSLVIAFGPTTPLEILSENLFQRTLQQRGWSVDHRWVDDTQIAFSMSRNEDQFCLLFSPPTDTEAQTMVVAEIPGPNARAGTCTEGSLIGAFVLEEIQSRVMINIDDGSHPTEISTEMPEPTHPPMP